MRGVGPVEVHDVEDGLCCAFGEVATAEQVDDRNMVSHSLTVSQQDASQ